MVIVDVDNTYEIEIYSMVGFQKVEGSISVYATYKS